jgi:hypothetical protein
MGKKSVPHEEEHPRVHASEGHIAEDDAKINSSENMDKEGTTNVKAS